MPSLLKFNEKLKRQLSLISTATLGRRLYAHRRRSESVIFFFESKFLIEGAGSLNPAALLDILFACYRSFRAKRSSLGLKNDATSDKCRYQFQAIASIEHLRQDLDTDWEKMFQLSRGCGDLDPREVLQRRVRGAS